MNVQLSLFLITLPPPKKKKLCKSFSGTYWRDGEYFTPVPMNYIPLQSCNNIFYSLPSGISSTLGESVESDIWVPFDFSTYWVYHHVLSSPGVWLFTLLLLVIAIMPDVVIRVLRKHWLSIEGGIWVCSVTF